MRKLLISMMLVVATITIKAQTLTAADNAAIDSRVDSFLELMKERKYSQVVDYMYPEIFNHVSKKEMFQVFELLEQAGIELKFNKLEVKEKRALPSETSIKYALIKYDLDMELPLNNSELKGAAPLMVPMLQSSFGKDNVEYNRTDGYIKVNGEKFLLGIEDPKYSDWQFLIYDDSFKSELDKVLPASVNQAARNRMN